MIDLADFRVAKNGQAICAVPRLHVDAGARLVLLGANGSGKTTLLRALAGLERDFTGTCAVAAPWRERVFVHQNPYLLRGTVLFNVMYGLRARGRDHMVAETHARAWLDRLGIARLAGRRTGNLSGGETRRVALARAFVLEPRLLLLDEPFAEMDADGTAAVCAALGHLAQATVLIASPLAVPADLPTVAYRITSPAARVTPSKPGKRTPPV